MAFKKSFPRKLEGISYPVWEEIVLTNEEERRVEAQVRTENYKLMTECVEDAKTISHMKETEFRKVDVSTIAAALFDKRASHVAFAKEELAKHKFDEKYTK